MGENNDREQRKEGVGFSNQIIDIVAEEVDINDYPEFETDRVYGWELVKNLEEDSFTVAILLEGEDSENRNTLLFSKQSDLKAKFIYYKFKELLERGDRQEERIYYVDDNIKFFLNSFGCSKCPRYTPVYIDIEGEELVLKIKEILKEEGRGVINNSELY